MSSELFDKVVVCAKSHFPNLSIRYKDKSFLMKLLSYILFFNKEFMTQYITTLGNSVYFTSESNVAKKPVSNIFVLLHELVHIKDYNQNKLKYVLLYLFPQILVPVFFILGFFNWVFFLVAALCLLPIPAYFRMKYEKRAYFVSLYVMQSLKVKKGYSLNIEKEKKNYLEQFNTSAYYYMWVFPLEKEFDQAVVKILASEKPFEDEIFTIIDNILKVC